MSIGTEYWKEFCGFVDLSFSEQLKHNEQVKQEFFNDWKNTKAADHLCPNGVDTFEDIPLTSYDDYPVLREFGMEVERLSTTVPQGQEEDLWDYYVRLGRQAAPLIDGWLADDFGMCCKTSGTGGDSKWYAHGQSFLDLGLKNIIAFFVAGCSDTWGDTRLEPGFKVINISGPSPYISNMTNKSALKYGFGIVPPLEVTEQITDMRRKIMIALKMIEKGERVEMGGGIASAFHLACRYFTDRTSLYRDFYQSMNFGVPKIVIFFMWIYQRLFGKEYEKAGDIMPLQGMAVGGFDTEIYADYLKEQFGLDPLNVYGAAEIGFVMFGPPNRRRDLMPLLNGGHFEFLAEDDQVKKINELEKDKVYELVYTPFRSLIVRYQMDDLFRVVDFKEDGLPIFNFESRKNDVLDFFAYFRLSEALAVKTMVKAGLPPTDKWAFVKETEPDEHLCLLMEKEWDYSELEASRRVFEALQEVNPYFKNYVEDFRITDPWKIIKVNYLQKGAFMRYIMLRAKEGVEMGQLKPLKLITPQNKRVADTLKSV